MKKERITELRKLRCQDVNRAIVYECLDEIERLQEDSRKLEKFRVLVAHYADTVYEAHVKDTLACILAQYHNV
jgi:hypothetical protein